MQRIVIISYFVLACAAPAAADEPLLVEAKKCTALESAGLRMTCYDGVFRGDGKAILPDPPPTPAIEDLRDETYPGMQWSVVQRRSEMDDSMNVFLSTSSTNDVSCGRYKAPAPVDLTIRCMENTTALIFAQRGCFFADHAGYGTVTYRLDQEPAKTANMLASSDHEGIGLWSGARAIPMAKSLFNADKMLVRIMPMNESAFEVEFDISALESRIEPLRQACGW